MQFWNFRDDEHLRCGFSWSSIGKVCFRLGFTSPSDSSAHFKRYTWFRNDSTMLKKRSCLLFIYHATLIFPCISGFSKTITLGGLFKQDDPCQRAFSLSVHTVNNLRHTTEDLANVFFVPDSYVITGDPFETAKSACSLLENGVVAIFGPSEKNAAEHVQSICDSLDMPNVVARPDIEPLRMKSINLYPSTEALSTLFVKLVIDLRWKTCTILYDSSDSLVRMNALLKRWDPKGYPVTLRHLGPDPNYRSVLNKVKQSGERNIVIDCSYEILGEVLKQSQQVGILSDRHSVIVSNLDLQTINLEPYQYSGVNMTGVRLVDVENTNRVVTDFLYDMGLDSLSQLRVGEALTYDGVQLFARSFKRFNDAVQGYVRSLACNVSDNWEFGASLSNYIRTTEMRGLTGLVKLHTNGFRSDFELDIVRLGPKGLKKIGIYNSTRGIDWRMEDSSPSMAKEENLQNKTLKILISLNPPYNMLKESSVTKTGNDRYEGFAIDIITELSKLLHFNYTFIETDSDYGGKEKDGTWSGMLGDIISGEADLAITDLTITSERESAVDFTMPFMNLGISILYRKPKKAAPSLFAFLTPWAPEVWLCLIAAWVITSMLYTLVGRMCPLEWNCPDPCIEEPTELDNQFTMTNSLWCTMGTITQQGSEISPIGASTKIMGASWGFFCMTIMASYTANLAAFLVVETTVKPIKSAEDLANLNGYIKYGAKKGGATYNFFKSSNYSTYATMFRYMEDNAKDVLFDDNDKGKLAVLDPNKNYAFLMESSSIQYIQQRECNLTQIGGLLDAKGYGIAMRKNYVYRSVLNTAVLHLQETGVFSQLKKKWWEEKRDGGKCKDTGGTKSTVSSLTLDHVGGVFLVLGVCIAIAVPITLWELIWDIAWVAHKENLSFRDEFMNEMRFIMKWKGSVKPGRKRKVSLQLTEPSTGGDTPPYHFVPTIVTTIPRGD